MRITINYLDPELWERFKAIIRERGTTISAVIVEMIASYVVRYDDEQSNERR